MKIALIGYGQMGHMLEQVALQRGHSVVAKIDPVAEGCEREISKSSLRDAEVCLDFSNPAGVMDNIRRVAAEGKDLVVGTTGWHDKVGEAEKIVGSRMGMVYSSNYSIGVQMFLKIVRDAAGYVNKVGGYDVAGLELHHNRKADSPSGTAKSIAGVLKDSLESKENVVYDMVNRKIEPGELHFASVRCGSIPGTHKVFIDSAADTIELSHTARSREGFAVGAVMAAEWISGRKGVHTFDEMINETL